MNYGIFKDLAIIFVAAKFLGIMARRVKAPQVVGEIIAGLLIGPAVLKIVNKSDFLEQMAEIGVVLLMFMAGLETDLKELIKTGPMALLVAMAGVFVPLGGGFLLSSVFHGFAPVGSEEFFRSVFIGVIMTATSVSITVETLRELGKLRGKVGTTILSAAIIDDVIGIIVMTVVIGVRDPTQDALRVVINTV
ncbi:MAG: cation:proton antiporter, partial [Lachnospiraceae bacterium]|nr:cation:proton antiporter [Lachnospiraceae bacterium]